MNSLSSIQTSQQDNTLDTNQPRIIASFLLPYTLKRDPKDRTKLKVVTSISNPVSYLSLLLIGVFIAFLVWST